MSIVVWGSIMTAARMAIAALAQGASGNLPAPLARLAAWCRTALAGLNDPYRPEKYYMRGPGPKCRAKAAAQLQG